MALVSFYRHYTDWTGNAKPPPEPDVYINTAQVRWVQGYPNRVQIGLGPGCAIEVQGDLEGVVSALTEGR